MTFRIVVPTNSSPHEGVVAKLAEAGCVIDRLPAGAGTWTDALIARYAPNADAYVGTFRGIGLTSAVLEASAKARVITCPIIGTEHIDVDAATRLGVLVAHGAAAENFEGMAEAGVMLAAALRKALPQKIEAMRRGPWKSGPPGRMMAGAVIGLLGFGRISRGIAARLAGWGCTLTAHDPYVGADVGAELGVTLVDFDGLLTGSDILIVLVTLTDQTRNIIDAGALARMKPGAALINIGRGGCVDEAALADALDEGRLSGAAIDTWANEPPPADHRLRDHPLVIATSHDVGHSAELYARIPEVAAENTLRALHGREPLHVRNPQVLPLWRTRFAEVG